MFQKRHPPIGARPGTLVFAEDAPAPRISVMRYTPEAVHAAAATTIEEIEPHRGAAGVLWVDIQGLGDPALLQAVADMFSIHPLALEDVVNAPQRPKTETYDEHQLYISRMVRLDDERKVHIEQVTLFFGSDYVLTFQERYGDVFDPVRNRVRQNLGPLRRAGADYLAYALIDTIIDHYYPVIDDISEALERLEEQVMRDPSNRTLGEINRMKGALLDLRRGVWPQRDAVNALVRGDSDFVSEPVRTYFRDTYDHTVQLSDVIETYRDINGGLFNTYLSVVSNRMNEVMKVLTIMASIFIPLTFLAGIYGMNFDSMPELHLPWMYPVLLGLMAIIALGMIVFFRRKGWL